MEHRLTTIIEPCPEIFRLRLRVPHGVIIEVAKASRRGKVETTYLAPSGRLLRILHRAPEA